MAPLFIHVHGIHNGTYHTAGVSVESAQRKLPYVPCMLCCWPHQPINEALHAVCNPLCAPLSAACALLPGRSLFRRCNDQASLPASCITHFSCQRAQQCPCVTVIATTWVLKAGRSSRKSAGMQGASDTVWCIMSAPAPRRWSRRKKPTHDAPPDREDASAQRLAWHV